MNKEIKIGDRILVDSFFGGVYHATVMRIVKGFFGKKYLCRWNVNSDISGRYETSGWIREGRIIDKD
jgi:hypothetical protein